VNPALRSEMSVTNCLSHGIATSKNIEIYSLLGFIDVSEVRTASVIRTPLKRRSTSTRLHGATSQKTQNFILVTVRTWNLRY
jgi:hypothetical protein